MALVAEQGGITELQMLQKEATILKSVLQGVERAETTDKACQRIVEAIHAAAASDSFLQGCTEPNPYHTAASPAGAADGCCVVL